MPSLRRAAKIARGIAIGTAILIIGLVAVFAIRVEEWRTGDQGLSPLQYRPGQAEAGSRRLWIDTDAACGFSDRTDPDDCFAIALLGHQIDLHIIGISTVFGNASREVVDHTTQELADTLSADVGKKISVYTGSSAAFDSQAPRTQLSAHQALIAALEAGPLTIVALGPLTNIATVLLERPDLSARITQLVAVMGRRPGHIFHPAEGADAGILFGHGPVFRDLNFMLDVKAVAQIIGMNVATTLIPYDAARGVEFTHHDLDRMTASGGAVSWVADRARRWLRYWQKEIGRQGFYPFDLLAAAYVMAPHHFGCAEVQAWVGKDSTLFIPFWRPTALLVSQNSDGIERSDTVTSASYCGKVSADLKALVIDRLIS
jgi:inosine-uridine nucleoside N-ribohydrolase